MKKKDLMEGKGEEEKEKEEEKRREQRRKKRRESGGRKRRRKKNPALRYEYGWSLLNFFHSKKGERKELRS